ncbi:MAG: carboxy terminal-processing peptidase [Bacteroidetes bacterium]|nr:carboxy terminal-processing peptidase [Bacteroidota bacterium]
MKVTNILRDQHYNPAKLNDEFSKKVYANVMDKLDNDKRFFTAKDVARLEKYKTSLDDQIKSGRFDFFDSAWSLLMGRLGYLESHINETLDKPFDYNTTATYTVADKVEKYQPDLTALKADWKRWLQYQTVDRLYRKTEQQKNRSTEKDSTGNPIKEQPFDTLEVKSRAETRKFCTDWFKRWRKMDRRDQIAFYINCVAEVYDPHTNYFPPEDKANFDISMTGKLEGIGATLTERDGYIKVERIVPGSASYKQGELKAGDLIVKVAQGAADPVDVVDMKLDDAIQLIRGKKGTEVRLTVKKPDGTLKVIPIVRDVVVIEESYARSAMAEYGGKKIGIIHLPSFYADFSERGRGRHSSEDVQFEIEKLKAAGVQGIIMDLRNNGGGSLADAIDMGGLFVPSGPIVQVRDPDGRVREGQDPDPSLVYDGPMVVMTNTYSASASEILAAALQDYKRAVIVGTSSTFGKGTVQTFVPIGGGSSTVFPKGYGQLKVTIQKFYRINGGTTQLRGVIPDVIIPDLYDGIDQGEKEMDYHLEYDKINPAKYNVYTGAFSGKMGSAIKAAQARVDASDHYSKVKQRARNLKKMRDSYTYSLSLQGYTSQQKQLKEQEKSWSDSAYASVITSLVPLQSDLDAVKGDATREAQRKEWLKMYQKDAALDQSIMLMQDLIR